MKMTQPELILIHSPRKNEPSQVELFSVLFFKLEVIWILKKSKTHVIHHTS